MTDVDTAGARLAALGQLTRGAAHELANPLFAVLGLVEFLLEDAEPGTKAQERLRHVHASALEMKEVLTALQGFARARPADEDAAVAVEEAARAAADAVRRLGAARDVELVELYESEAALVAAPRLELEALLVHLLVGAERALAGGGTIMLELEHEDDAALLTVGVTPGGLASATVEAALARALAERHGGSLAEEETRFVLRLPLAS